MLIAYGLPRFIKTIQINAITNHTNMEYLLASYNWSQISIKDDEQFEIWISKVNNISRHSKLSLAKKTNSFSSGKIFKRVMKQIKYLKKNSID